MIKSLDLKGSPDVPTDLRHVVSGKIERNDPEFHLSSEIDVYYRYNWALKQLLDLHRTRISVLELGCGLGWFPKAVIEHSAIELQYLGIDIDDAVIREATRRTVQLDGVRFLCGDVCNIDGLSLPTASFDVIVWFENLEHLHAENYPDLVNAVRRYVRPGGRLLVSVPNRIAGGGLRACGPLRTRGGRSAGQHNPHHVLEPTLDEVRFMFPGAVVRGYEPGSHLPWYVLAALRRLVRAASRLGLRPNCSIDHRGVFDTAELSYMSILARFPSMNRAFLIRECGSGWPCRGC